MASPTRATRRAPVHEFLRIPVHSATHARDGSNDGPVLAAAQGGHDAGREMRVIRSLLACAAAERDRLALWLPVLMGVGVLSYFQLRFEPWPWSGIAATTTIGVVLAVWHRVDLVRLMMGPMLAVVVGFTAAQWATIRAPPPMPDLPHHAVLVTGRVQLVETLPEGRRLLLAQPVIDPSDLRLPRMVRVRLRAADTTAVAVGDTVRVRSMLRPIGPPLLPGGWDMQRDAYFSGLGATGYALASVEVLAHDPPEGLDGLMRRLAQFLSDRISAAIPGSSGQIAVGILIGSQTGIAPADMAAFRDSGLAHLLSVSGLHLTIVIGVSMMVVRLGLSLSEHASLFWPTRSIAALVALAIGGFYTVLTGSQIPTVRCFLMACLVTAGLVTGRRVISLRSLGLAAAMILLTAPWQLLGVSLQMSFAAVLALIAGFEALRPTLTRMAAQGWRRWVVLYVVGSMASSLLAGTATLPFGAYHFGRVQLYYVLSNLVGVPLTSVLVMPAGMLALPLMAVGLEWLPLTVVGWGIDATLWIARVVAALPAATVGVPTLAPWGLAVLTLGMLWLALWTTWPRLLGLGLMLLGLASPALHRPADILVSHDGGLIAARSASGVYVQQARGNSGFARETWLRHWGEIDSRRLPPQGEEAGGAIRCGPGGCLLHPRPDAKAAWLARTGDRVGDCTGIAVIVSAEPARGLCDRPWPALVDRFTVWKDGPTAIWLEPSGARVLTDRADRGARPWVPPPPTPRVRPPPRLPSAPVEGGSASRSGDPG